MEGWVDDLSGLRVPLSPGRDVTVGRQGDIAFPDNPNLHRTLLRITWHDEAWWLTNVGSWIVVRTGAVGAPLSSVLASGDTQILSWPDTSVVFRAGRTEYEVIVGLPGLAPPDLPVITPALGRRTDGPATLTLEQMQLLLALCEPMLRRTGVSISEIPSMSDVSARLGWTASKTGRKLDYLCEKLDAAGVSGLVAETGERASNRRVTLVEWALGSRLVTAVHLELLP